MTCNLRQTLVLLNQSHNVFSFRFIFFTAASGSAHAGFLVDASIRKHMPIMQRLAFSIAKIMQLRGSFFTVGSFGKGYNQVRYMVQSNISWASRNAIVVCCSMNPCTHEGSCLF